MSETTPFRGWVYRRAAGGRSPLTSGAARRYPAAGMAVMAVLTLLLFWVYGHRPLVGLPWQWADDGLYLRQGEGIVRWLHGDAKQWLGPYDEVILAKAPLFAVWMATLYILQIPLRLAEFAVLLLLPWLFVAAVRPLSALRWWQVAAAGGLLCALPLLPTEQRLLRTALQLALTSGCQISVLGLMLRARRRDPWAAPWAATSGLLFALAYLNREESIWLAPMVLSGFCAILFGCRSTRSWQCAAAAASLVAAIVLPITVVSSLNYRSYGVFFTTSRRAPEFTRAHRLMAALEPDAQERYVPINQATRLKAYAVSPTFARLSEYLEGPASDAYARNAIHLMINGRSPEEREFFVTSFQAVLQEAVFKAGARSAPDSEIMFAAIARELESAIALGRIGAGWKGVATLTAPHPGDVRSMIRQTVVSLRKLFTLDGLDFPPDGTSSGSVEDLQRMETLTHTALAPTAAPKPLDLPDIGVQARRILYIVFNRLLMVAYALTTAAALAFILVTATRHRRDAARLDQAFAATVLCGSLLTFSVGMAMTDVLGFPLLKFPVATYNNMGYGPLSVLGAFGLVLIIGWSQSPPRDCSDVNLKRMPETGQGVRS
jgi:hypothetical protein